MKENGIEYPYTSNIGSFLIIWIIKAIPTKFIAEVIREEPLTVKVMERGPLAKLTEDDFLILENETHKFQGNPIERYTLLLQNLENGHPICSGLISLGVIDGRLHGIMAKPPDPDPLPTEPPPPTPAKP